MKPNETVYAGDAQFVGWSDSHTGGPIIKLRLPSSDDLDKFRALTIGKGAQAGHLFSVAIVEHDGAGNMAPPPEPTKASPGTKPKGPNGPLCIEAIDLCRMPNFQRWVAQQIGDEASDANAKEYIIQVCGLKKSRKEIDQSEEAKLAFINFVRVPFLHWEQDLRDEKTGAMRVVEEDGDPFAGP